MTTQQAPEIMARRTTSDEVTVEFWTDGAIGIAIDRYHSKIFARKVPRILQWVIADDLCIFSSTELAAVVRAARKAWDLHVREPHRIRECDVRRCFLVRCPA